MTEETVTQGVETKSAKPHEYTEPVYGDREQLDAELFGAISDILSAEQEAKHIIAKAEESAKAVQLDRATRERDMREANNRKIAETREQRLRDAMERAEHEREKRIAAAKTDGEKLVASKEKAVKEQIARLYSSIGGKA